MIAGMSPEHRNIEVLPGVSAAEYLEACAHNHPRLFKCLNPTRSSATEFEALYAGLGRESTHFEGKLDGGRGDAYREAQNADFLYRSVGFLRLFDLGTSGFTEPSLRTVLDALGGNGTMTRIVRASRPSEELPFIVTNDASARMIESALAQGLPAIRQPLQNLIWFDDCTFDAVIVAYGTHHIPPAERAVAISEAYRVLKPGGRVVLQDFEIGCPTTHWYANTLDRYTRTGHRFEYFTRTDFEDLLVGNSFVDVETMDVYDPIVAHADNADTARITVLNYVLTLFALDKLVPDGARGDHVWQALEAIVRESSTFDPARMPKAANGVTELCVVQEHDRYRAEIPRICLAAVGRRPSAAH